MKKLLFLYCTLLVSGSAEADSSPQSIALSCRNCHSSFGSAVPDINGLTADEIRQALLDFKSGRRESTVMGRLARGFSDREIQAAAKWLAVHRR